MEKKTYQFEYQKYNNPNELSEENQNLIDLSKKAAEKAYAPYSKFRVGAAILLENGEILSGSNQENASYPVGICAERTLLSYAHANFPESKKLKLAISVLDTSKDVSPCGLCRQTLLEYESLQGQPIEIMLHNMSGTVIVLPSASSLLPLHFNNDMLT
ncbi:cytidine deaminase [Moheibacter sp.]|uniref:cytidine deaminase n=1 Tax=Moheibacter sp. TaxID=1965316 RepID=UPI003C709C1A